MYSFSFFRLFLLALVLQVGFIACDGLQREIDIDLPEHERQLVVEAYLEPGKPYRVLLTESKGYFDDLNECPFVRNALVTITHAGQTDTLQEAPFLGECSLQNLNLIPFFGVENSRFFNYGSNTTCPIDYSSDFVLEVFDTLNNRQARAVTRILPPVPVDSLVPRYRENDTLANLLIYFRDIPGESNIYRAVLHESQVVEPDSLGFFNLGVNPIFDFTLDDSRFLNPDNSITLGTGFDYTEDDTLIFTLYHIEPEYELFLESVDDAIGANFNPFAEPATVIGNVRGGIGVFAALSFDRDTIIFPAPPQ